MNDSNPFATLSKKLFPSKKGSASSDTPSTKIAKPEKKAHRPDREENHDAGLFLDAMQNTRAFNKDKKSTAPDTDSAELFQAAFSQQENEQSKKVRSKTPTNPKSQPEVPASKQEEPFCSDSEAAEFIAFIDGKKPVPANEDHLFTKVMNDVLPLASKGREVEKPPKKPVSDIPGHTPADIMQEILDGKIEFSLNHTDEYMEGFVIGIDPLVMNRLRAGHYSPEAHVDLHGQNSVQAYTALSLFIKNAYQRNMRTVLVITGRGKNSPSGISVIRHQVQTWLMQEPFKRVVLAFCSAVPGEGGTGAMYIMLRKYKKSRTKICWERPYDGPGMND